MRSEEQWKEVDRCPDCNSPIHVKGGEVRFTGPADCLCWLPKDERKEVMKMSKFSKEHYEEVADVIRDWRRYNPGVHEDAVQSLINGFDLMFRADSKRYDRFQFEQAVRRKT